MPEKQDVEFQIGLLKIQIESEMATGFFTAAIVVGLSALVSIGIGLTFANQYNSYALVYQTVTAVAIVIVMFVGWRIALRKIDKDVENLGKKFAPSNSNL